jgi:hypothetical protein
VLVVEFVSAARVVSRSPPVIAANAITANNAEVATFLFMLIHLQLFQDVRESLVNHFSESCHNFYQFVSESSCCQQINPITGIKTGELLGFSQVSADPSVTFSA